MRADPPDDAAANTPPLAELGAALQLGLLALEPSSLRPLWVTPAAEKLLGWPAQAWRERGASLLAALLGEDAGRVTAAVQEVAARGILRELELRVRRPDGGEAWLALRLAPANPAGPVLAFVSDVSRRRDAEDDVHEQAERLARAQRLEAMGRIAGRVAHELNNLLTVVGGYAGLLVRRFPADSEGHREALEIATAATRATEQTRHLLAFGRAQAADPRRLDIGREVRALEPILKQLLEPAVRLEIELGGPVQARLDPATFEQILVHLVVRARDLRPRGDVLTLRVHAEEFGPERGMRAGVAAGARAVIEVLDRGPLLSSEQLAQAFEPVLKSGPEHSGLGLALSAVHALVVQSGGAIEIEATPPAGTRFSLSWPRWEGASGDVPVDSPRRRVLLIEDEPTVREVAHEWLSEQGFEVLLAAGRDEALALAATPGTLDAVIADLNLRDGESGDAIAERIALERPGVRILLISGGQERPARANGRAFLAKPFDLDELGRTLRTLLELPAGA